MRTRLGLLAACAVLGSMLAGCTPPSSDQSKTEEASTTAPAAPAGPVVAVGVQPGQWRTTVTILDITAPGLSPAAIAQIKAKPIVDEDCSTAEDVKEFAGSHAMEDEDGMTCTTNSLVAGAGRITGEASCTDADGSVRTSKIEGVFSATHVNMDMSISGVTPEGPMSQKMHLVAERLGECKS